MPRCKECDEHFNDEDEAMEHVIDKHSDTCDNLLQEYVRDSQRDAYDELIEEGEDDE